MNLDLFRGRDVRIHMSKSRIFVVSDPETIENLHVFMGSFQSAAITGERDPQRVFNVCGRLADTVPHPQLGWCHRTWQNWTRILGAIPKSAITIADDARPWIEKMQGLFKAYAAMVRLGARAKAGEIVIENELKKPARPHQVLIRSFAITVQHCGIFADCGLGKTYTLIDIVDWFKKQNGAVKALVVCPLAVIETAWGEDIEEFSDLRWINMWAVRGSVRKSEKEAGMTVSSLKLLQRQQMLEQDDLDIWIINPESMRNPDLVKLLEKKDFDIVAVDEASLIKNAQSKTFKGIKKVSRNARHRYPMTGTPSPNGITDIWPLFDFIDDGETLDKWFVDFREDFCTWKQMGRAQPGQPPMGRWDPKPGAVQRLAPVLTRRSISLRLEDCMEMPPYQEVDRYVEMNAEQAKAYRSMQKELFMEFEGERITVRNQLAKLMKLRQVTGGFVFSGEGAERRVIPLKRNPKMEALDQVLSELGHGRKAVVWSEFPSEIKALLERYKKSHRPVAYYGGIKQKDKDENVRRFTGDDDCLLMLANPKSCGFGVRFTSATYSISFSIDHRHDTDYQKNRRLWRPPQQLPVTGIYLLCKGTIDVSCRSAARRKKSLEEALVPGGFNRRAYEAMLKGET